MAPDRGGLRPVPTGSMIVARPSADRSGRLLWGRELEPGERLIWHGRPTAAALARANARRTLGWSPVFAFACYYLATSPSIWRGTFKSGDYILVPIESLFLVATGAGVAAAPWAAISARWTHYAITDRRALILKTWPRRRLQTYLPRDLQSVERRGNEVGDLIFRRDAGNYDSFGTVTRLIGFLGVSRLREAEAAIAALHAKADGASR